MSPPTLAIDGLRAELTAAADPERARQTERYMKGHARFLGVAMPDVHRIARPHVRSCRDLDGPALIEVADRLWAQPEREFHHVGVDLLRRWVDRLGPDDLDGVERLITTTSWWDTVDLLASRVVGPMVATHPALGAAMDEWIDRDDVWIARSALLHQIGFGERTDAARLFDHVDRRCADTEFFIRKACGWALRAHAATDPVAVRDFVESRGDRLSGLTRREAMKHLGG